MKNYIAIIILFMFSISLKAQYNNIVPLEDYYNEDKDEIPDGTYFKDVNHVLNKYVGTWNGESDGKQYTIQAIKTSEEFLGMKKDLIYIRYIIKDSQGNILKNTIDDLDAWPLPGKLFTKDNSNVYSLIYYAEDDDDVECGDVGAMYIEALENNTKLKLYVKKDSVVLWTVEGEPNPCPNGRILPPFPDKNNPMILNKISTPPLNNH